MCFGIAGLGSYFTSLSVSSWYTQIAKPSWNPPNKIFGPAWGLIFLLMAISGWLIWQQRDVTEIQIVLGIFILQLVLNVGWSGLFFGLRKIGIAALEVVLLWLVIGAYILLAWPISTTASLLFLPYWLWVGFASLLNMRIWFLNKR